MFRFAVTLMIPLLPVCGLAQDPAVLPDGEEDATVEHGSGVAFLTQRLAAIMDGKTFQL
jgi:hypothetical protein